MKVALEFKLHKCSVCQCDFTDDEGGVHGEFGIIPVSFCPDCTSCFYDMAEQLNDREWEGLTDEEKQEAYYKIDSWSECVAFIEAKLKEKNT